MLSRSKELLDKLLRNECSESEKQELFMLVEKTNDDQELKALLEQAWNNYDRPSPALDEIRATRILENILHKGKLRSLPSSTRYINWRKLAVAASVLLAIGLGTYFLFFNKGSKPGTIVQTALPADVKAPGINRAMITLANGDKVYLDSIGNGQLAMQGNVQLVKLADGQIAYRETEDVKREIVYNTLTNPRSSKVIDMILADGSHVWLNAGSSITYPVAFIGNERKVKITGEAYFEVATAPSNSPGGGEKGKLPFIVSKDEMQVTVLGTHFNVNAYDDEEDMRVTLLEGSVRVESAIGPATGREQSAMLKPGQQAKLTTADSRLTIHNNVDLDAVMAWKNGLFSFSNADLPTIMRQLARWYNVEVEYEGAVPAGTFEGKIGRDLTLTQLLNGLASTRVHYKIEGNKITILSH